MKKTIVAVFCFRSLLAPQHGSAQIASYYAPFKTINDMQLNADPAKVDHVIVASYGIGAVRSSGGGGRFHYVASAAPDSCDIIQSTNFTGYWLREQDGGDYDVRNCGADPAASASANASAFANAVSVMATSGGGTIAVPGDGSPSCYSINTGGGGVLASFITMRGSGSSAYHLQGPASLAVNGSSILAQSILSDADLSEIEASVPQFRFEVKR